MKTFNTATTVDTKTYLYEIETDRFGTMSFDSVSFGFFPDVRIIVDAHLTAQEIDVIFNKILVA
jgi:hypothetical protein|tara:strand:- start:925 stop:1116 length:192 start_codon:yes stop_codon:yes gene_type:complete